jgi:tubulin monoglycylase TTLL3/8
VNKLSYKDFQRYLERRFPEKKTNFYSEILPQIKEMVRETILASYKKIDTNRRLNCMEIFGYDFMIDRNFKPWLIEVNTNPCLELSSKYLNVIIPSMLDNAFKIVLDCIFPAPIGEYIEFPQENRFELIFHEFVEGKKAEGS